MDSDIINTVQYILRNQFPEISGFQSTLNAPIYETDGIKSIFPFSKVSPPSAQILHDGHDHWVFACQREKQKYVLLFDSLNQRSKIGTITDFQVNDFVILFVLIKT